MNEAHQPQIWHYGLVSLAMAELWNGTGPELDYFARMIETYGQPALDVGCAAGRLLIPLLKKGLEVDGVDYSADMLAQCERLAKAEGLAPQLYHQSMHEMDLPRNYRTIIACGVVGLGGSWMNTQKTLQRCYDHLRPGGCFVFDYNPRYNDPPAWLSRLPENRHALPDEWGEDGEREKLPDGSELAIDTRTIAMDPLEDVATRQMRVRLYQDGKLVKEEIYTQMVEDFSLHEWLLMLEKAGFEHVKFTGDYTGEPATADHGTLVFVCEK